MKIQLDRIPYKENINLNLESKNKKEVLNY